MHMRIDEIDNEKRIGERYANFRIKLRPTTQFPSVLLHIFIFPLFESSIEIILVAQSRI